MASAQAITDQFIVSRVASGLKIEGADMPRLHKTMMEDVIHGYDVLPTAVHLTASTLGMLSPSVTYRKMNLFVMPIGVEGTTLRLGSLDFIGQKRVSTQLTLDNSQMQVKQTDVASSHYTEAEVPVMDLCVMNPPFVRSSQASLLFGHLPEADREKLQTELKARSKLLKASVTAGMGSVFLAIADKHLRVGGRLAFILPIALATGESWGQSRKLLADGYHVETVIVSHDADRPNFSENTNLSEIMFIARKLQKDESAGQTTYVNLWANPTAIYEAMELAELVRLCTPAQIDGGSITSVKTLSKRNLAEVMALEPTVGDAQWTGVQFAQAITLRAAVMLGQGMLSVPGSKTVNVHLCKISDLGLLGPDTKRVHEGFTVSSTDWSPYSGFWNHDSTTTLCIKQKPNTFLTAWDKSPRGADYGSRLLWPRSGRIMLAERLRTNTHRVIAIGFDETVLGNTWWALKTQLTESQEKTLLLWLNSTPSLLLLLTHRVTAQGSWMNFKQPQWQAMPVLDVRALSDETLTKLAASYDTLCNKELMALGKLGKDPVRASIDDALSSALGLPDIKPLRQLLAREPGLTGVGLSKKPEQSALLPDTDTESASVSMQMNLL